MSQRHKPKRTAFTLLIAFVVLIETASLTEARADGILGFFRPKAVKPTECAQGIGKTSGDRSNCDCEICRSAQPPWSPLRRYLFSHNAMWLRNPHSYTAFRACPPYHQPTFGVHQTCWRTIPEAPCLYPVDAAISDADHPSSSEIEFQALPPVVPEGIPSEPEPEPEPEPEKAPTATPMASLQGVTFGNDAAGFVAIPDLAPVEDLESAVIETPVEDGSATELKSENSNVKRNTKSKSAITMKLAPLLLDLRQSRPMQAFPFPSDGE